MSLVFIILFVDISLLYAINWCCGFVRGFMFYVFSDVERVIVSNVLYQFERMNIILGLITP
jgi:hypothetical protein